MIISVRCQSNYMFYSQPVISQFMLFSVAYLPTKTSAFHLLEPPILHFLLFKLSNDSLHTEMETRLLPSLQREFYLQSIGPESATHFRTQYLGLRPQQMAIWGHLVCLNRRIRTAVFVCACVVPMTFPICQWRTAARSGSMGDGQWKIHRPDKKTRCISDGCNRVYLIGY